MAVFSALMFESKKTQEGFGCMLEDIPIQLHEDMTVALVQCEDQQKVLDACDRMLRLCDEIERNDGKLDAAVRSFVNQNNELANVLGITFAMEDAADGAEVQSKKPGILKTIWEHIKKFFKMIFNAIGSVFHWLGNVFSTTDKKLEWLLTDGINISKKAAILSQAEIEKVVMGMESFEPAMEDHPYEIGTGNDPKTLQIKSARELLDLASSFRDAFHLVSQGLESVDDSATAPFEHYAKELCKILKVNYPIPTKVIISLPQHKRIGKDNIPSQLTTHGWTDEKNIAEFRNVKASLEHANNELLPFQQILKKREQDVAGKLKDSPDNKPLLTAIRTKLQLCIACVGLLRLAGTAYLTWLQRAFEELQDDGRITNDTHFNRVTGNAYRPL